MISEISFRPKPSNNKAKVTFYTCLAIGLGVALFSMTLELYRGVVGVLAIPFIVAAVYTYQRYMGANYSYDVVCGDSGALFVVRQLIGKRSSTLVCIDLASVGSVKRLEREALSAYKPAKDTAVYRVCPTMSPEFCYCISSSTRYSKTEILVELTAEAAALISSYAAEAKELKANEDDDY